MNLYGICLSRACILFDSWIDTTEQAQIVLIELALVDRLLGYKYIVHKALPSCDCDTNGRGDDQFGAADRYHKTTER